MFVYLLIFNNQVEVKEAFRFTEGFVIFELYFPSSFNNSVLRQIEGKLPLI